MRVLVTGAAGFIGRHLLKRLGGRGIRVFGATRRASMERVLRKTEPDIIVHAAGSLFEPDGDGYFNNVVSMAGVLDAALKGRVERIIFLSSAAVYGESYRIRPGAEESSDPRTWYSRSKRICENMLRDHSDALEVIVLRLPSVVGPGKKTGDLVTDIIHAFTAGRTFKIHGTGKSKRQFVDIDDLTEVIRRCVKKKRRGKGFLLVPVAGSEARTIKNVAETVAGAFGGGTFVFDRKRREAPDQWVDPAILKRRLGYSLRTSLDESIRKIL